MTDDTLLDSFERLLGDISPLARVRAVEKDGDVQELWASLEGSGFLDALVPEDAGGAALALHELEPLFEALGRRLTPAPVADTIVARALLSAGGRQVPKEPIVLAAAEGLDVAFVPLARVAKYALVDTGADLQLASLDGERRTSPQGSDGLTAALRLTRPLATLSRPPDGLRVLSAVLRSAEMAGAATRLLEMTVAYANARNQFGKPIGKQQAVQQQLAVMAEKTVMMRMAARIGCLNPTVSGAATAKSVASACATEIAAIAHAVHGAIGISEEYDLQLFTRRLYDLRFSFGAETYWSQRLGEIRLADPAQSSLDFVRRISDPPDLFIVNGDGGA